MYYVERRQLTAPLQSTRQLGFSRLLRPDTISEVTPTLPRITSSFRLIEVVLGGESGEEDSVLQTRRLDTRIAPRLTTLYRIEHYESQKHMHDNL